MRVMVILGAAVWPGGEPSPTLRRRCNAAAALWRAGGFDRVIPSGGLGENPPAEAEVMARLLVEGGVPEAAIEPEDQATTTIETARRVRDMLLGREIEGLTLVTDATHAPRAWLAFRALGLRTEARTTAGALPSPRWPVLIRQALRECVATPYYVLRLLLGGLR